MSLTLIEESAKEVRRLAVAGSPLAAGDFRLKKLIPPLEQAGAKVPVFAQVAKAMSELVSGKEAESSTRLLNLSTLLNAILYTQGQSGAEGDFRELALFPTKCASTRTTARVLKPLVMALTSAGGGRYEQIKSAFERGAFNDLRLIDPAIRALGDNFPEIADFVAAKVLPGFGPGIVPRLKSSFDIKGKRQDARKLEVMHQLDPVGTLDLCKTVLDDSSPEVKAAAITCLGKHEECLPLVLEQAKGKNKQLRAAALLALAEYDRAEITELFTELVKGKALDILAEPFRVLKSLQVLNTLLAEGKRVFESLLKNDPEQIPRFWEILNCLAHRKDAEVEQFLLHCLASSDKLSKIKAAKNSIFSGTEVLSRIVSLLYNIGSPKAHEALLAKATVLPAAAFPQVLRSALRAWPPEKVYSEFSPLLTQKAAKEKVQIIQVAMWNGLHVNDPDFYAEDDTEPNTEDDQRLKEVKWDPRWLDAAIASDQPIIACCLARPNHKGITEYLLKLLESKHQIETGQIFEGLVRCHYPKVTDLFLETIRKRTKGAKPLDYRVIVLLQSAAHLPPADFPRLEAFAGELDEKFVDHFLTAIEPLRPKREPAALATDEPQTNVP